MGVDGVLGLLADGGGGGLGPLGCAGHGPKGAVRDNIYRYVSAVTKANLSKSRNSQVGESNAIELLLSWSQP
ncbi:hypothetical protein V6N13_073266 [Hibiscus sabdariffa]